MASQTFSQSKQGQSDANLACLVFTDLFAAVKNPAPKSLENNKTADTRIQRLGSILSQGTFGAVRQQVVDLFLESAGIDAEGRPARLNEVVRLCQEISNSTYKLHQGCLFLELWYDPFTGRLELSSSNGQQDSLSIWARQSLAMAA